MMELVTTGTSRTVLLVGRYAIKLPCVFGWKRFLNGLLANMQEREFSRTGWPELCPVLWSVPGGWVVVMPRVRVCTPDDMPSEEEFHRLTETEDYTVPAEHKADSWAIVGGRYVAVDYGS